MQFSDIILKKTTHPTFLKNSKTVFADWTKTVLLCGSRHPDSKKIGFFLVVYGRNDFGG
jgi:hypothetical protein